MPGTPALAISDAPAASSSSPCTSPATASEVADRVVARLAPIYTEAVAELETEVELLKDRFDDVDALLKSHTESVELLLGRSLSPYVISRGGHGTFHSVRGDYNLIPPQLWKTACGWRYATSDYVRACSLPCIGVANRFCDKCIPQSIRDELIQSFKD